MRIASGAFSGSPVDLIVSLQVGLFPNGIELPVWLPTTPKRATRERVIDYHSVPLPTEAIVLLDVRRSVAVARDYIYGRK